MEQIKNTKILAIVGVALVIIAVLFMPFITAKVSILGFELTDTAKLMDSKELFETGSECYYENTTLGVIILILAIVTLVMIFADSIASKLNGSVADFIKKLSNKNLTLLPTVVSAILMFISLGKVEASDDVASFISTSPAVGFWVALVGVILVAAYPFVYKKGE